MRCDAVAPDGSPVELYRRLPPLGEPETIHAAVPAGAPILELGCGAGRVTHALVALEHPVTAVDNSPAMLAHVRGAETVLAEIETLELGRTFPVVVLASHFVNEPDPARRTALLRTCARHVAAGGRVLIEAYAPDLEWEEGVGRPRVIGDVTLTLVEARREGPLVHAVMEYAVDGTRWRQRFTAALLDETELAASLAAARLALDTWLDDRHTWLAARRAE